MYKLITNLVLIFSTVYSAESSFIITPNGVQGAKNTLSNNVCKVTVNCQMSPTGGATVQVGTTTICNGGARTSTITVPQASTIKVTGTSNGYFRVIVTEIPNSCAGVDNKGEGTGTTKCDAAISSDSGFVSSPEYPKHYPNMKQCKYTFPAKSGFCGVKLRFTSFDLEVSPGCQNDYMKLANKSYCGNQLKIQDELSYEVPMHFEFHSNNDINGGGFLASYIYLKNCDEICNKHFTQKSSIITPPMTSNGDFSENFHCAYSIEKHANAQCLKVTIKSEVKVAEPAELKFTVGGIIAKPAPGKKTEGDDGSVKVNFPKNGNGIIIDTIAKQLKTDDIPYTIIYKQITDPKDCDAESCAKPTSEVMGFLKNPDNPKNYPANYECEYVIYPHNDKHKKVMFILKAKLATGDKLELIAKEGEKGEELEVRKKKEVTFSEGKPVKIKFTSDGNLESTFQILFLQEQEEGGDGENGNNGNNENGENGNNENGENGNNGNNNNNN